MKATTTGRALALAAGVLATGGALAILLQDLLRTWVWQLEHGLIPVLMAVQILTAHSVTNALRARRSISVIGFAVVAAVATWGVLYTSVGKQSKVAAETTTAAEDVNRQRADLDKDLARNKAMLAEAQADLARECRTGKGKRCDGIAATVKVYADAIAGVEAKIGKVGPRKPVAASADKMAEVLAVMFGSDQAKAKHVLLLVEPFTYATIFELAALVSFGFAFGHGRRVRTERSPELPNGSPNSGGGRTVRRWTKDEAAADLVTRLVLGERFGSQDDLRERYGVAKSTMSDWLAEWERSELIPARTQDGRRKALAKA